LREKPAVRIFDSPITGTGYLSMNTPHLTTALSTPLPSSRIGFHYVLVLEWLDENEPRTGTDLHAFLESIGMPSALVVCRSADDVRRALQEAHGRLGVLGKPAVHIEAHGSDPYSTAIRETAFGMEVTPGMTWYELGDWLAPLNAACGFELLVVGATCFGFGAIAAMKVNAHVAPFAACVGFTTPVIPGSIRDAMRELYRSIANGAGLRDSVAHAAREVRNTGETLQATSSIKLALQVLRGVYDGIRTPEAMSARVSSLVTTAQKEFGLDIRQHVGAMPAALRERSRIRIQEAWDCWFPTALQDANPAYKLNWSLVEEWWPAG
jgi:hypothetical protein